MRHLLHPRTLVIAAFRRVREVAVFYSCLRKGHVSGRLQESAPRAHSPEAAPGRSPDPAPRRQQHRREMSADAPMRPSLLGQAVSRIDQRAEVNERNAKMVQLI